MTKLFIKLKKTVIFSINNIQIVTEENSFCFHFLNKMHVIMESCTLAAWRYLYLHSLNSLRATGYKVTFLNETWYHTHGIVKKDVEAILVF